MPESDVSRVYSSVRSSDYSSVAEAVKVYEVKYSGRRPCKFIKLSTVGGGRESLSSYVL